VWHVWHDSFICVTWLIHMCDMTHLYVWHDPFIRVTWLVHMCDMTHSYVWHDSFIRVTWLIHMCDMTDSLTHSHVWHDTFRRVTWLIHTCDVTNSCVWHDSFEPRRTSDITHSSHVSFEFSTSHSPRRCDLRCLIYKSSLIRALIHTPVVTLEILFPKQHHAWHDSFESCLLRVPNFAFTYGI